jgi:hypothetical protein
MDVCPRFSVVLSCVGRRLAMGRSAAQSVLPRCMKGFIVSEVNFELEQTRTPNS